MFVGVSMEVISYSLVWKDEGAWDIVSHCAEPQSWNQRAYLDLVPILTGEGIQSLLLETLLTLRKALVPIFLSDSASRNCCPSCRRISCVHSIALSNQESIEEGYSLSDSHNCDRLPSRRAVVVKVGCRRSLIRKQIFGGSKIEVCGASARSLGLSEKLGALDFGGQLD